MIKRIGLLWLLWFVGQSGWAEENTLPPPSFYQVEILVFETKALRGWTEEFWPWPDNLKNTMLLSDSDTGNQDDQMAEIAETLPEQPLGHEISLTASSENFNTLSPETPLLMIPSTQTTDRIYLDDVLATLWPENAPEWIKTIRAVEPENYLLQEALQKLTPQKGYQVIYHRAWRQPAYPDVQALPLAIDEVTLNDEQISGTVKFYKNRYAHMDVDLTLWRKIPPQIRARFAEHENLPLEQLPDSWPFSLQETRKMKSGDWHYLDHPLFGVLMVIQRIEQ